MYSIMYKQIVNPATGRKVSVDGKIGKQVLQQYKEQIGGNFLKRLNIGRIRSNNRTVNTTLKSDRHCLTEIPSGAEEKCYEKYTDNLHLKVQDEKAACKRLKANNPKFRLRDEYKGGYGTQCQTKLKYKLGLARDSLEKGVDNLGQVTVRGLGNLRETTDSQFQFFGNKAKQGFNYLKNTLRINQNQLLADIERTLINLSKYNNCLSKDGSGTILTSKKRCKNLKCGIVYDSTSTDGRVNNCQRDLKILLSKYMQQKYSLEDLKTYLQRSKHENLIEASQLLKNMLKQKDTETVQQSGCQKFKVTDSKLMAVAGKEIKICIKEGKAEDPCSKCDIVSNSGVRLPDEQFKCRSKIQNGGDRNNVYIKNKKNASKKNTASKKKHNDSKNNNRR